MQIDIEPKFPIGTAVRIIGSETFGDSVGAVGIVTDFNHGEYLNTIPPQHFNLQGVRYRSVVF